MEQQLSTTSTSPSNSFHYCMSWYNGWTRYQRTRRTCPAPSYGQIHMTYSVIHGSKYRVTTHSEVVDTVRGGRCRKANLSSDRHHDRRCLRERCATQKAASASTTFTIEPVVGGHHVRFDIGFWNSYNGQWSIQISGEGRRLFCDERLHYTRHSVARTFHASTVPTSTPSKKPTSSHAHSISSSIEERSWKNRMVQVQHVFQ